MIWRHPLNYGPSRALYMYHAFVIIETEKFWWSAEKNTEGITLQRSQNMVKVEEYYLRQNRRGPFTKVRDAPSGRGITIIDLIDFIYGKDLLKSPYNVLFDNCKSFAAAVFDQLSVAGTSECTLGVGLRLFPDLP